MTTKFAAYRNRQKNNRKLLQEVQSLARKQNLDPELLEDEFKNFNYEPWEVIPRFHRELGD